ncbi:threonine/serine dehydratase [Nonomuraea glycinis]|uniref:threonine ammonia-lyase n=1 Tax=Nonomuraea glycinis TaxID=2047744 RepID=A0A918AFB3_9ACTN|nr:threonine/serine dehydratase [Nonomuraea glycinis]MCA2181727.1 threonine/serine dehydratase [Nonomuraea glycinis]GGP14840.1 threonine dehydratase [Nonomuraea glycinis]
MTVSYEDVVSAAERIGGHVLRTPVLESAPGRFLKLEQLQHSGSFKVRGAFNRILSAGELPEAGVIAASGGNHGLAVAYAARALGVRAEIFVPEVTSPVKLAGLRALGAQVTQTGTIYSEAAEAAAKRAAETGALKVHAYDQPEVVAGQGTTGLELMAQTGGVDTIVVAVGGGGFAAGVAVGSGILGGPSGTAGRPKLVAVEPERIPTLHEALKAGEPVPVEVGGIAADALGATQLGDLAYGILSRAGAQSVLVTDDAIVAARRTLWEEHHLVAEYAGATAYAALLAGVYVPEPGERVAVLVCGANTDPATLAHGRG